MMPLRHTDYVVSQVNTQPDTQPAGDLVPYSQQERAGLVRRAAGPAFVAADPKPITPVTVDAPAWLVERQPLDVGTVWTPTDGAQERTSAMDRAKALRVRLLPFVGLWGLLAVIVGAVVLYVAQNAPGAALVGLLVFTALTAGTYIKLNGQDYEYSREGTERHRVSTAAGLAREQMQHEHELRRLALGAYLEALERHERGK